MVLNHVIIHVSAMSEPSSTSFTIKTNRHGYLLKKTSIFDKGSKVAFCDQDKDHSRRQECKVGGKSLPGGDIHPT